MFDVFAALVGAEVESLDCSSARPRSRQYSSRDNLAATVKYADGSLCTLVYTALGAKGLDKEYLEVHCGQTSYVLRDYKELTVHGGPGGWSAKAPDKGHAEELRAIKRYCDAPGELPIPLEEIAQATRISILADKAA